MKIFYAKQFLYDQHNKLFSAFASDLGIGVGKKFQEISIVGRQNTVRYRLYEVLTKEEGWVYRPDGTTVPGAIGTEVLIFND